MAKPLLHGEFYRRATDRANGTKRAEASLKALVQAGGARKTYRFKPDAFQALQEVVRARRDADPRLTETEVLEQLLLEEAARQRGRGRKNG